MDERRDRRRRDRDREHRDGGDEGRGSRDSSRHKESSRRRKEHDSDRREDGKRKRNWESDRGDDKRKKHSDPKEGENVGQDNKRKEPPEEPNKPSADVTTNGKTASEVARIKEIVERKKKEIAEKLKKVSQQPNEVLAPKAPAATTTKDAPLAPNMDEAIKRAQECVTRLGFQQAIPLQPVAGTPASAKAVQAPPLLVDSRGRQIDERGAVVDQRRAASVSTLKVNINKQKRDAFQILHPELEEDPVNNPHFDSNLRIDKTKLVRQKRSTFQFVEQGKWVAQAEAFKLDNLLGQAKAREIRAKQAILAKAKAEGDVNPNLIEVSERALKDDGKLKDPVPDVEWWDAVLLPTGKYSDVSQGIVEFRKEKINIYVEHPVPIEPPAEPAPPPPQPIKLTKREQKKMRTQRRLAREKERQEMIRQGKIEPPKPKVKMSNMMKVLASEATQDPTRLEQEIRSAAAERERAHVDRNLARKLTPAERREKKEKKLFDDPNTPETIVSVYRVKGISHSQTRFKVDVNAQENRLTGCALITDAMAVIIVEGGLKSIKRYDKLMMRRINWAAREDGVEAEEEQQESNKCIRVWQGSVARPAFERFSFHKCHTAAAARKFLDDLDVAHYWDSAVEAAPVPEVAGAGGEGLAAVTADAPPPLAVAGSS